MKLNKLKTLALASLLLGSVSCQRYLDEPQPTNEISPSLVFASIENAEANLTGITSLLRGDNETYISTTVDATNLGSVYFARTVRGEDFIVPSNWFAGDYSNTNRISIYRRAKFTWEYFYKIIRQCNEFIDGVNKSSNIADTQKISYC